MRKCYYLFIITGVFLFADLIFVMNFSVQRNNYISDISEMRGVVRELGLSDLAVSTEARYTRHPAVSDPVVPFMDHPLDIEHFPTGSFWRPVR